LKDSFSNGLNLKFVCCLTECVEVRISISKICTNKIFDAIKEKQDAE
jgi:hypothetical protein